MTYGDKLRDPRWQKKRLEVLERAGWKCQCCESATETLEIHHLIYSKGEPWEAPDDTLECLCSTCHEWRTDFDSFFSRGMAPTKVCVEFQQSYEVAFKHWDKAAKNLGVKDTESLSFHIAKFLERHRLKTNTSPFGPASRASTEILA